ncbi:MAG TPA: putative lipid II flippase FtsW [Candidatus Methylomirabilis sp.]|nr:putative lipid II flippase FtsW [Candidatus Methylomirabilis sp.]
MTARRLRYDRLLCTASLLLVGIGVVMVYSSSAIKAQEKYGDPFLFLKKQLLWTVIGLAVMVWAMHRDYRAFQRYAPPLFLASLLLLLVVLIPSVGVKVNGARRWLRLFGISFQPSELAKLSLILVLASFFARKADRRESFLLGFAPPFLLSLLFVGLVVMQPNFGTGAVLMLAAMSLCFMAGVRLTHLATALVAVGSLALVVVQAHPYAKARLLTMIDPVHASSKAAYQIHQSFYALGPGGILGRGLGDSIQKLFYLPESHTEFIFAIVGEEMGFVGALLVIFLFGILLWRGTRIALRAPDLFGTYTAMGVTFTIISQAAINLAVVVGLLPTTGVPLPFLSFGGSSLVTTFLCVGILLSISRYQVARGRAS